MTAPFGFTCTFITRTPSGTDPTGNTTYTNVSRSVPGCMYAPGSSSETMGDRLTLGTQDTVVTKPTLYAPAGTVVGSVDRVTVPGFGTFEVDGDPQVWPAHPRTGWLPSNPVVVHLRQVTG